MQYPTLGQTLRARSSGGSHHGLGSGCRLGRLLGSHSRIARRLARRHWRSGWRVRLHLMAMAHRRRLFAFAPLIAALLLARTAAADVLPDDRADVCYSKYSGGGMNITGYSALVRKKVTENFAVEANYFVDKVSGASVDVLSQASVIKDTRKQKTLSV